MLKHFWGSLLFTVVCLALGGWYGWAATFPWNLREAATVSSAFMKLAPRA